MKIGKYEFKRWKNKTQEERTTTLYRSIKIVIFLIIIEKIVSTYNQILYIAILTSK